MESRKRTLIRTITYRIIVTIVLAVISLVYTGNAFQATAITIVYSILATLVHYVHDRIWFKVKWGKLTK